MLDWLWIVLWVVAGALVLMALVGVFLPKAHSCTVARTHRGAAARVWKLINGVEDFPRWRTDVKSVEVRERDADGRPVAWTEQSGFGPIPLRTVRSEESSVLVSRIDSDKLPFGGTWTYRLEPTDDGVELSITEDGEIRNVVFRFLSRFVFGYDKTMRTYHDHLAAELAN